MKYKSSDLKRYILVIAKLGGCKGYVYKRKTANTAFCVGLQKITAIIQDRILYRGMSRR